MLHSVFDIIAGAIFVVVLPVIANVYAWKHSETSGIVVTTLTIIGGICMIIFYSLFISNKNNPSIVVEMIYNIAAVVGVLILLAMPIIANVFAWKHDKLSGAIVSTLSAAVPFLLIVSNFLPKSKPNQPTQDLRDPERGPPLTEEQYRNFDYPDTSIRIGGKYKKTNYKYVSKRK